jgi:acetyl-CoA carboxylase biotin carboxylase subunit
MRIVKQERDLEAGVRLAQAEAKASFNDERVYIEKLLDNARHIEVQILADSYGTVKHLFERECSIQRRHQKLLEESPSPALTPSLRKEIGEAALEAAKILNYRNAGTVEFLLDNQGRPARGLNRHQPPVFKVSQRPAVWRPEGVLGLFRSG